MSEAAAEGQSVRALESALERLAGWLQAGDDAELGDAGRIAPRIRGSIGCSATWCPTSPAAARPSRSSTGSCGSGTWATRCTRCWRGSAARSTTWPSCAGRQAPSSSASIATTRRSPPNRSPRCVPWSRCSAITASSSSRVELDLGFGRGIGFYTQMIFELTVPTPRGPVEVCGGGRYDGLARVLGSTATTAAPASPSAWSGCTSVLRRTSRADRRAAGGRQRLSRHHRQARRGPRPRRSIWRRSCASGSTCPIVVADLEFQAAIDQARALGLGHVVTVGRTIELWNLEDGDVRSVHEGELIDQMRTRAGRSSGETAS